VVLLLLELNTPK
jgi:hypothetical protein